MKIKLSDDIKDRLEDILYFLLKLFGIIIVLVLSNFIGEFIIDSYFDFDKDGILYDAIQNIEVGLFSVIIFLFILYLGANLFIYLKENVTIEREK